MPVSITEDVICKALEYDDPLLNMPARSSHKIAEMLFENAIPNSTDFRILRSANFITMEIMQDNELALNRFSYKMRFRIKPEAFTAFRNLSNDADFVGNVKQFAEKLVGYATLYQEALIDAEICPIEPYCSKMLDARKLDTDEWYQRLTPEYRRPSLESILGWAADTSTYCQLYNFLYDSGIDSMIEAFQAGVPIADILA